MIHKPNLAEDASSPVIAVPVRDEAERLPKLLTALGGQNNCQDGSAAVVHSMARALPQLRLILIQEEFPAEKAHAGSARRAAMDAAFAEGGWNAVIGNPEFGCDLAPIDFVAFANACGADGYRCERASEVKPAIQAALNSPRAALVEAVVDANEKPTKPNELKV